MFNNVPHLEWVHVVDENDAIDRMILNAEIASIVTNNYSMP